MIENYLRCRGFFYCLDRRYCRLGRDQIPQTFYGVEQVCRGCDQPGHVERTRWELAGQRPVREVRLISQYQHQTRSYLREQSLTVDGLDEGGVLTVWYPDWCVDEDRVRWVLDKLLAEANLGEPMPHQPSPTLDFSDPDYRAQLEGLAKAWEALP